MRPTRTGVLSILVPWLAALTACGPGSADPPIGDPPVDDPTPPVDVGSLDAGTALGSDAGSGGVDAGPPAWWGEPIDAPKDAWTWVDFPDTRCANGEPTGLAINPSPSAHPSGTVIYMEPGGACWNAASCGFHWQDLGLALHLDGFDETDWNQIWGKVYTAMGLFNRENETNPFRDANFVFLPYCTGDVFAGQAVKTLEGLVGGPQTYHFTGHLNVLEYLARLVPTFPDSERVWLIGSSAGGFGAEMNWTVTQEMFGEDVRVDVISDSGQPIDPPEKVWQNWLSTWDLALPEGCPDCDLGPRYILDYYLDSGVLDRNRYALIVFSHDIVISAFFGLTQAQHAAQVDELLARIDDPTLPGYGHAHYFARPGPLHTTFLIGWDAFGSEGVQLRDWLTMFVDDDPALMSVGP